MRYDRVVTADATLREAEPPIACDMNLGPRQRARRLRVGVASLIGFAGLAAWLIVTHRPPALRAIAFVPATLAALGFLQYLART